MSTLVNPHHNLVFHAGSYHSTGGKSRKKRTKKTTKNTAKKRTKKRGWFTKIFKF